RHLCKSGLLKGKLQDYLAYDPAPRSIWPRYQRCAFARADHILTPSEFSRSEIHRFLGIPLSRITVTPLAAAEGSRNGETAKRRNGENTDSPIRPFAVSPIRGPAPYLLYVGGYERHKNIPGLLEMFSIVRRSRPELRLILVGTGQIPSELRHRAGA